jgi:hypothetical protein
MCFSETCSKVYVGKYLCDAFHIQNGLEQGEPLSLLLFDLTFEYSVKKAQENREGLELNGIHQLGIYADDVNLLGENVNIMKKNKSSVRY